MQKTKAYPRKDNRWEARLKLDGENTFKCFYGATKEVAEKKLEDYLIGITPAFVSNLTVTDRFFGDLAEEWLKSKIPCTKESTRANYRMKLDKHILSFFGNKRCSEVSANDIYTFINTKLEKHLSARYVSDILIVIKAVFRYGSRHYGIKNVTDGITVPKTTKPKAVILTGEQQARLKHYLLSHLSLTAICVFIALELGLRVGEICGLKWSDVDFDNALLYVNRTVQRIAAENSIKKTKVVISEPKSQTSKRSIPIPAWFIDVLKSFKSNNDNYILSGENTPVEPRTLQYRFAALLKKVDLPSVKFHSLRHAFATNAVKLGFDTKALSEILGHSSVEITLNKYVHPDIEQKRVYMERMTMPA